MVQGQPAPQPAQAATPANPNSTSEAAKRAHELLILYITDYCVKREFKESASTLRREARISPEAKAPVDSDEGLLYEWWTCFWDVYTARLHPEKSRNKAANQYARNFQTHIVNPAQLEQSQYAARLRIAPQLPPMPTAGRPFVNGSTVNGVNGHPSAPTPTYPAMTNGPNGIPPSMSAPTPTALQNPTLQHLQQPVRNGPPRQFPTNGAAQGRQAPGPANESIQAPATQSRPSANGLQPAPRVPGPQANGLNGPQSQVPSTSKGPDSPQQPAVTVMMNEITTYPQPMLQELLHSAGFGGRDLQSLADVDKIRLKDVWESRKAPRGQKRASPADEEHSPPKDSSPPQKRLRRNSQGATPLPTTSGVGVAPPALVPANAVVRGPPNQPPVTVNGPMIMPPRGQLPNGAPLYPQQGGLPMPMHRPGFQHPNQGPMLAGPPMPAGMHGPQMAQLHQLQQAHQRINPASIGQPPPGHQLMPPAGPILVPQQPPNGFMPKVAYPNGISFTGGLGPSPVQIAQATSTEPPNASAGPVRGPNAPTVAPKGAMLPPPPPSPSLAPQNAPITGPLINGSIKPGSSPDGQPAKQSPESSQERPASRVGAAATPQAQATAPTPGSSAIPTTPVPQPSQIVASPSQALTQNQANQLSQNQSPSLGGIPRPGTASGLPPTTAGGMPGPARGPPYSVPPNSLGPAAPVTPNMTATTPGPPNFMAATPASASLTTMSNGALLPNNPSSDFLMALGGFDMQMMNFPAEDPFNGGAFDLYDMYINESTDIPGPI